MRENGVLGAAVRERIRRGSHVRGALLSSLLLLMMGATAGALDPNLYPSLSYGVPQLLDEETPVQVLGTVLTGSDPAKIGVTYENPTDMSVEVTVGVPVRINLPGTIDKWEPIYFVTRDIHAYGDELSSAPGWKGYRDTGMIALLAAVGIDVTAVEDEAGVVRWEIAYNGPARSEWTESISFGLLGYGETRTDSISLYHALEAHEV